MFKTIKCLSLVLVLFAGLSAQGLFFSEYIEGSSNNKALEIYNPTDTDIDLSGYAFPNVSNAPTTPGEYEYWNTFDTGAIVPAGGVYVIAHPDADPTILAVANQTFTYLSNGDDGFSLVQGTETDFVAIDWIGDWNGDPGSGWDVCGQAAATQNHTLVRAIGVNSGNDWAVSSASETCEWDVYDQNTFTFLGSHTAEAPTTVFVTFQVDVSELDLEGYVDNNGEPFYGVYATGSFDGWAGWGTQLTDDDADGIYVGTAEIPEGTYEYLFTINGWNGLAGNPPLGSECDWNPADEFANYGMVVGPEDFTLDVVCWQSCMECIDAVTIYDIQGQADASPYAGQVVETSGVVTATNGSNKHFIQDGTGAWNGIYIYDSGNTYTVGDNITLVAEVTEYYDLTELMNVASVTVNSSGNALPEPVVLTTAEVSTEDYEGVLVTTIGLCDNEANNYGEWSVDDGSGTAWADDQYFTFAPVLGTGYAVTGPLNYSYGAYKILPRDAGDIVEQVVVPEFTFTFNVAGAADDRSLTVGFSAGATDGYDAGLDTYAPPAPPAPSFDVALGWENDRYFTQILNGAEADWGVEHTYEVLLQFDESSAITFTWDNTGLSELGTFVLEDAFGGNIVNVDMNAETSLSVDNPALTMLKLRVTPGDYVPPVDVPNFVGSVNFAGASENRSLTFGFSPEATDGYDAGLDAYAPPAPPAPSFDVALGWENDRYFTQILNGAEEDWEVEHVYTLQLQYDESGAIALTWDNTMWEYYGNVTLRDGWGGVLFNDVDMVAVNSFVFDNPAFTTAELSVKPGEYIPLPPPPPPAPELTATAGPGSITLSWTAIEEDTPQNGVNFTLPITVDAGGETSYTLTTGFSSDATDGYDEGIDLYAPPAPPPPSFDAALNWQSDRYYTQILNGADGIYDEHVYDIQLQFDSNNLINLTWENAGLADLGTFILQDAFGGMIINVDMTEVGSVVVDNVALNLLKVFITPVESNYLTTFDLYRDGELLVPGLEGTTYTDTGLPPQEFCYTITQNMVDGSVSDHSNEACATPEVSSPQNLTAVFDDVEENIDLSWDAMEQDIPSSDFDFILPITVDAGGDVSYTLTTGFSPLATDGYDEGIDQYAPPAPPPPSFDAALSWQSDRYYTQILNGADGVSEDHIYDIQLQFDSNYLINLTWDNTGLADLGTFILQDAFGGMIIDVDMTEVGSVTVDNPALNLLKVIITPTSFEYTPTFNIYRNGGLYVSGIEGTTYTDVDFGLGTFCYTVTQILIDDSESGHSNEACVTIEDGAIDNDLLPVSFALHQNYPNPFNPITTITYDIAEETFVNVSIYNLMGQKVRTLVSAKQIQGQYFVQWDARNDHGGALPTGVYIYRIDAGSFTDVRKLVLMK